MSILFARKGSRFGAAIVKLVPASIASSMLAGCAQSPDSQLVGKWTFSDIVAPPAFSPDRLQKVKDAYATVYMDIRSDRTYELNMPNAPIKGEWGLKDRTVSLSTTTIGGLSPEAFKSAEIDRLTKMNPPLAERMKKEAADPELKGVLSEDGKTLTVEPRGGQTGSLLFKKTESK